MLAALAISGCATTFHSSSDANPELLMGAEAAGLTADATTPSVRMLGMSADRKLALRRLAERSIRNDNPGVYTVVKGDTLWDISERFLSRPWLWPEIWQVNPQIENPHLIYPGDRVSLTYVDGQPRLQLIRAASRTDSPISSYPADGLSSFLVEPKIVSSNALKRAPYVVATEDDRLVASIGNHIYARGDLSEGRYSIYRPGKALIDPDTDKVIGHEAIHVSQASLVKSGDPSKLVITSNKRETLVGDRLMTTDPTVNLDFQPRNADIGKAGRVISLFDALARVGQNQVVVINLGEEDGVQAGDMLSVFGDDRLVRDTMSGKKHDMIKIEGEKSGTVMVFRTFEEASYALVVQSRTTINLHDRVGGIEP
ncbi:MAG: LysM domain-containing protein [Pseudomonadota bacterium]